MKAAVLIPVLVLGLSWTFQGVPAEEEGTEAPTDAAVPAPEVCEQEVEVGPCKLETPRFFYNLTSMTCTPFTYGGCKGNQNNFESEKECWERCGIEEPNTSTDSQTSGTWKAPEGPSDKDCLLKCDAPVYCHAAPKTGPCKAMFRHYYYNPETKTCELFTYGGCCGNGNNFQTKELCMEKCHHEDA